MNMRLRWMAALAGIVLASTTAVPAAAASEPPSLDHIGAVAWGGNGSGQLGDRTTVDRTMAVEVYGLVSDAVQVAGGSSHSLVLKNDGKVWGWGDNEFGQIGNGTNFPYGEPELVVGLSDVIQISANGTTSMALLSDGTVYAWGANFSGKLGDGTTKHRNVPVKVVGLDNVIQIAAGGLHSVALRADGTVWAWGAGTHGQLGDGFIDSRPFAAPIPGLTGVTQVAAGFQHNIALLSDGTVRTWGSDSHGQLGDGLGPPASSRPLQPVGLRGVVQVAAGFQHSLACTGDKSTTCGNRSLFVWGRNTEGQLGAGNWSNQATPVNVESPTIYQMIAGFAHTALLVNHPEATGRGVLMTGANHSGQLGDGTLSSRNTFDLVLKVVDPLFIATGDDHTVAVKYIQPVVCCG